MNHSLWFIGYESYFESYSRLWFSFLVLKSTVNLENFYSHSFSWTFAVCSCPSASKYSVGSLYSLILNDIILIPIFEIAVEATSRTLSANDSRSWNSSSIDIVTMIARRWPSKIPKVPRFPKSQSLLISCSVLPRNCSHAVGIIRKKMGSKTKYCQKMTLTIHFYNEN